MKKILLIFVVVLAAGFGGTILHATHANAAELTSAQATALQASLNSLETQFVQLESEANAGQPIVQPTQPTVSATTISPEDAAALDTALTALTGALEKIQSGTVSPAAVATLGSVGKTLASIETSLNGTIAMATPSNAAPTKQKSPAVSAAKNAATPAPEGNLAPLNNAPAAATANIASSWSKNLPWVAIAIVFLIIVSLMIWLWRRDKKDLSPVAQ